MALMTYPEVAALLRLSTRQIYRLVRAGTLPAIKISPGITRFRRVDVERLLRDFRRA